MKIINLIFKKKHYRLENPNPTRGKAKPQIIDLELFDKYLENIGIDKITYRTKIIMAYKRGLKNGGRIHELQDNLKELGYEKPLIEDIVTYVINGTLRNKINKRLVK